jgi:hypothetical protein
LQEEGWEGLGRANRVGRGGGLDSSEKGYKEQEGLSRRSKKDTISK